MLDDGLREGKEREELQNITDANRLDSESRLAQATDFDHTREDLGQKNLETKHTKESDNITSLPGFQESRVERAQDISELTATREKKSEIIENMVQSDFPISAEKRMDNAKDFYYLGENEFTEEARYRNISSTEEDIGRIEGFYDGKDGKAFVKDQGDTLVTSIHEKLHQKSMSELPSRLNEGITEHFARKEAGAWGELKNIDSGGKEIPKIPSDYEKEVEIVRKLEATVGEKPLNAAYFEGRTDILKSHVDSLLGDGAFLKISDALEKKDYETASAIIERYYKR